MRKVVMEKFYGPCDDNTMLLHFSGRIAKHLEDDFQNKLFESYGVDGVQVVTPKMVCIDKDEGVSWKDIIPAVQKVIRRFWGEACVVKRTRRAIPQDVSSQLVHLEMDSLREEFWDCALTDEERDALGFF